MVSIDCSLKIRTAYKPWNIDSHFCPAALSSFRTTISGESENRNHQNIRCQLRNRFEVWIRWANVPPLSSPSAPSPFLDEIATQTDWHYDDLSRAGNWVSECFVRPSLHRRLHPIHRLCYPHLRHILQKTKQIRISITSIHCSRTNEFHAPKTDEKENRRTSAECITTHMMNSNFHCSAARLTSIHYFISKCRKLHVRRRLPHASEMRDLIEVH